jgi:stage II sporulation protein D
MLQRVMRAVAGTLLAGFVSAAVLASTDERLRSYARDAGEEEPILRIGLEDRHVVVASSRGRYRVLDAATWRPVWHAHFEGELRFVAEGGPAAGSAPVHRVQVGAFSDRGAAERESRRLAELTGVPGIVRRDADRGTWRVRLGGASDRLALEPVLARLREEGVEGAWIAEEPAEPAGEVRLRLVDEEFASAVAGASRLVIAPETREPVSIEGRPYRGIVELRLSPWGTVRPINWVGIESYLRGVVPAELGPELWPELEALAAQAVAARTYAWRNRGQFSDEGFDLCSTPRCQVYAGLDGEHPLSDRAVRDTRHEILTWQGTPIVALYTATCGGHTENGADVFAEHAEPYLAGVACGPEPSNEGAGSRLSGRLVRPIRDDTGVDVTRDWQLLAASGVIPEALDEQAATGVVGPDELRGWTRALARLAGLPAPDGPPRSASSLAQAATAIVADLGWSERAAVLLRSTDLGALLRAPDAGLLEPAERRALAYLVWLAAWRPFPDGSLRPGLPPSRARLASVLVRIGESYDAFALRRGRVSRVEPGRLRIVEGKGALELALAPAARLFGASGGAGVPVAELEVRPGDALAFRTDAAGRIDFLELVAAEGAADDRSSRVYSWEVRRSRRELEETIARRLSVGRLRDLRVLRRGVSGRVVELEVVGEVSSSVVRGFDVTRLLDLRDNFLVIEIQRDAKGEIDAVVFAGKGWGHGVGLCQVGAYGMALRGAGYREILAHYYSGTELRPLEGG